MNFKILTLSLFTASALFAWADSPLSGTVIGTTDCYNTSNGQLTTTENTAANLFDGDGSTYFATYEASYTWGGLDLGTPHVINKVRWMPAPVTRGSNRALLGVFQGANSPDFLDAVPLAIITEPGGIREYSEATVDCSKGFRYVRYIGPSESRCMMSEIEFYGEPGEGDASHYTQITNLPTVCVNTVNAEEPYDKEHEIAGRIIIISDNGANVLNEPGGIRERGNASRSFPKKPWRIKFDKKQSVLDAPAKAKKWTLINNYGDKTLMRNKLAFDVAEKLGMSYVPFCRFVDVVLNGEYKGSYQLCDQIEVNKNRVNITEMKPTDIEGEALSGGYFVEVDAYASEEACWFTTNHYYLPVTIKSPDEDEITPEQYNFIRDYFNLVEDKLKDTDPVLGYRAIFDTESFIQHMLTNEVAGNTDAYWSTYMYKDRSNDVIYTGPVWDFDLAFNNDQRIYPVESITRSTWLWDSGRASAAGNMRYFAQRVLIKDESTKSEIQRVWSLARNDRGLNADWLCDQVDAYAAELDQSQTLNFKRWGNLTQYVHQNPQVAGTYSGECDVVKRYIRAQFPNIDRLAKYDPSINSVALTASETDEQWSAFSLDGTFKASGTGIVNLAPGFYIIRQGSKVSKVLIR